jgi:uncharacterized membrane protein
MASIRVTGTVTAFMGGVVVALVAIMSGRDLSAAKFAVVHTCAAADGTLHMTSDAVPCAPGERRVRIQVRFPDDTDC